MINTSQQVQVYRSGLQRTRAKLAQGTLTIGYIGGSITDGRAVHNWPYPVTGWFADRFPTVRICEENAAIGATGSPLAAFRAQHDLIDRNCDLVFVEYAVNDNGLPSDERRRTREGLLRQLLAGEGRDIIIVYTYCQDMYADMVAGQIPVSIREFEELADHYGIPSVWMGLHAFNDVKAGRMRWEEWLPDGLHPQDRGSYSYAQSVIMLLEQELIAQPTPTGIPTGGDLPPALHPGNWERIEIVPFSQVTTTGPWVLRRWPKVEWIDQVLETAAVGAQVSFDFEGRGLGLGFDFGKTSAEFRYRLDGAEWVDVTRDRPDWCGTEGWFRLHMLADELVCGKHTVDIEVTHGNRPECAGTNFRLGLIGVVK